MHVANETTKHTPNKVHLFALGAGGLGRERGRMEFFNYCVPIIFPTIFLMFSMGSSCCSPSFQCVSRSSSH
jgi:hypothetical protein